MQASDPDDHDEAPFADWERDLLAGRPDYTRSCDAARDQWYRSRARLADTFRRLLVGAWVVAGLVIAVRWH